MDPLRRLADRRGPARWPGHGGHFMALAGLLLCGAMLRAAEPPTADAPANTAPANNGPIAIAELTRREPVRFVEEILPILRQNCLACHNAAEAEGNLVLETPEAMRKGGEHGPAIAATAGSESLLLQRAARRDTPAMPPADNQVGAVPLTSDQLGLIKLWIDQGASGSLISTGGAIARRQLPKGRNPILSLAITPDDELVACGRGQRISIYDLRGPRLTVELIDPQSSLAGASHGDLVRSLAFDRAGDRLASGGFREVKLWRRPRGGIARKIAGAQAARSLAVSADGAVLALGWQAGGIELHDLTGGKPARTLSAHEGAVSGLVFSTDGARLFSASADKTLKSWDVAGGQLLGTLKVPEEVRSLALLAGGQIATGDADHTIRVWPLELVLGQSTADPLLALREFKGHGQPVTALATAPAMPDWLLSGGEDGRLRLWSIASGEPIRDFDRGGPIAAVAIRPDGRRIVSAEASGVARLWNPEDGALIAELKVDDRAARSLVRGDGAVNCAKACIEYRKEEHREAEEQLKRDTAVVEGANQARQQAEKTLTEKTELAAKAVEARSAAEKVAELAALTLNEAKDKRAAAQIGFDLADETLKQAAAAAEAAKAAADGDQDNKDLATARETADKALADANRAKESAAEALMQAVAAQREAEAKNEEAGRAAYDATEKAKGPERELAEARSILMGAVNFIATADEVLLRTQASVPAALERMQAAEALVVERENEKLALAAAAQATQHPLRAVAFSADNRLLAIAGDGPDARLYDAQSGAAIESLPGAPGNVAALAFASDGRLAAAGAEGGAVIWNTPGEWTLERTIGRASDGGELTDRVLSLDFSPDGQLLATGGGLAARSGELKLWNVADGGLVREMPAAHRDTIYGVRFSPDGQYLATASADRLVKIFRVADGALIRELAGHTHHVLGVCWQPDGRLLASCGGDQVVKLWDFESGAGLRTLRGDTYQLGEYRREVNCISFVGATEHLLTSSGDRSVRLHRTSSTRDVRAFREGASFMHAAVATSDGKLILAGGQDGVLWAWNGESGYAAFSFLPGETAPKRAE